MVATENKRELVYNSKGVLINTKPLRLPLNDYKSQTLSDSKTLDLPAKAKASGVSK